LHKGAHSRFVAPDGARPESAIGVAKDGNGEASRRPLGLTGCKDGLEKELRQVAPTPNPEPRDGHEGHQPNNLLSARRRADPQTGAAAMAIT
jgi:hypothetical protein